MSKKKTYTTLGLTVVAIILVTAIFAVSQSPKQTDINIVPNERISNVTIGGIEDDVTVQDSVVTVTPPDISAPPQEQGSNSNDIALTNIEEKPEPPELPTAIEPDHDEFDEDEIPTDTALSNPTIVPDSTPRPVVTPVQTPPQTPSSGDKNDNGEIYIPGFGWVANEGGGGQGQQSSSDLPISALDDIIGH
jgi:hypothetical protein